MAGRRSSESRAVRARSLSHAHALMDALVRRPKGHPWRPRWQRELPSTCPCCHGCPCAQASRASMGMAGGGAHPNDAARDLVLPIARARAHALMDALVHRPRGHPWRGAGTGMTPKPGIYGRCLGRHPCAVFVACGLDGARQRVIQAASLPGFRFAPSRLRIRAEQLPMNWACLFERQGVAARVNRQGSSSCTNPRFRSPSRARPPGAR